MKEREISEVAIFSALFVIKVKIKVTQEQATKSQKGSRGVAIPFL
jgi:hypothetical protein